MESKDNLINWFNENFITLINLGGSTKFIYLIIFIYLISVMGLGWAVSQIPADYFISDKRKPAQWKAELPFIRIFFLVGKNLFGVILIIGGVIMLFIPGQGILTIIIGIFFMDYPGKYKLEQKLISIPAILKTLNWMRIKSNKPPLIKKDS